MIKYYLIIKHFVVPFRLGKSRIKLFNNTIYYDSRFGLAGYQRILSTHQRLLKISKVRNIKTIVDVGANVGYFSMLGRMMFPKAKIYAIEPITKVFRLLEMNFNSDLKIKLFNSCISDSNKKVFMTFDEQNPALSRVSEKGKLGVKALTLDSLIISNEIKTLDILKIDTEMYEQNVLYGAQKTLERTKYLFIEITLKNNQLYTFSSLISLLYKPKKFNFQLVSFRNFADVSEGEIPIVDCLFKNINYHE